MASRCRLHMAWGGAGRSGSLAIRSMTAIWFILAAMTAAAVLGLLWPMSRRAAVPTGEAGGSGLATETAFYEDQIAEIERDLERGLIAPDEAETAKAEAGRRLLRRLVPLQVALGQLVSVRPNLDDQHLHAGWRPPPQGRTRRHLVDGLAH